MSQSGKNLLSEPALSMGWFGAVRPQNCCHRGGGVLMASFHVSDEHQSKKHAFYLTKQTYGLKEIRNLFYIRLCPFCGHAHHRQQISDERNTEDELLIGRERRMDKCSRDLTCSCHTMDGVASIALREWPAQRTRTVASLQTHVFTCGTPPCYSSLRCSSHSKVEL